MNAEKLSNRLQQVANFIPIGARLADIGSDHAYLPCYAVLNGIASYAIAGEVVEGPFQSAKEQVKINGLQDQISVRKGNGLAVIENGEVDCVTIAGMGGSLIASILENGKEKLGSVQTLILQPNVGAQNIRNWLIENGWELTNEVILEEDGKIYEILVATKGNPQAPYGDSLEKGLLFGPFLLKEKNEPFRKKWQYELNNWQRILTQLEQAGASSDTNSKKLELQSKIKLAQEVLQ